MRAAALLVALLASAAAAQDAPRFPAADTPLPRRDPVLPAWARVLADPLPRTTAAMLELDHLHRAENPLGPVLAGKLRWAAADALRCDYVRRTADADLRRAGVLPSDLAALADPRRLPPDERAAVAFARKLTLAAYTVTDEEVADLVKAFGAGRVVAMVHTVAYVNFHARIVLALGVKVEPDGPLPPFDPQWDVAKVAELKAPPRPPWDDIKKATAPPGVLARPAWDDRPPAALDLKLDAQKARTPRIPLLPPERLAELPQSARDSANKILWNNVSAGYQPRLTQAWFDCLAPYYQEAQPNRVFTNSMFWVITRTNDCFY